MERLPRRIRVLGRWFTIENVYGLGETDQADAQLNLQTNTIQVDRCWPVAYKRECVLHEVTHAIIQLLGVNPKSESGHRIVSVVLDAVFADNPSFVRLYKERPNV